MAQTCKHTIHQSHFGWNNANKPVLTIAPGETVEFKTTDSSGGQLNPRGGDNAWRCASERVRTTLVSANTAAAAVTNRVISGFMVLLFLFLCPPL